MAQNTSVSQGTATITIGEAIKALTFHVQHRQNCILFGAPGIGKTDIAKQVVANLRYELDNLPYDILIMHPQVADPTDFKGMPGFNTDENGVKWAEFFAFGDLRRMIEADRPLVVFLDDFGQAPRMVQAAIQQLILERRIDGHKISDHVRFIMCANRAEDKAGVEGFLTTIKTRAFLYTVEPTVEDYSKWAIANNYPPECVAFIRFRGLEFLWARANPKFKPSLGCDNERTPRTVTNAFDAYVHGIPDGLELAMYAGATDGGWAIEWLGFSRMFHALPNIDLLYTDPSSFKCPGLDKVDVLYATTAAIAGRATKANAKQFFELVAKLPQDFGAFAVKDAFTRCPDIANTNHFVKWFQNNPDVIEG